MRPSKTNGASSCGANTSHGASAPAHMAAGKDPQGFFKSAPHLIVIAGESREAFSAFCHQVERSFVATGPVAAFLVTHLATLLWRLRRSATFEAGLLTWIAHRQSQAHDRSGVSVGSHFFPDDQLGLPKPGRGATKMSGKQRERTGRTLGEAFNTTDVLGKMGRYEAHLMRQAERTMAELRRLGVVMKPGRDANILANSDHDAAANVHGE